jgi:hypothetical protein
MRPRRGQAAVETALTLPLLVFMILGAIQLFMLMQARILAQYAASRAVRAGAQNFGDCFTMYDAAHLVLLPAIDSGFAKDPARGRKYADEVRLRMQSNRYVPSEDDGRDGPVVWMDRLEPLVGSVRADEEETWDLPPHRFLDVRMVFWAPLKIPFANWVFVRIAMAHFGLRELHTADPLMPVKRDANWVRYSSGPRGELAAELVRRFDLKQYVFPIQVTYATRMMSPVRFTEQNCPR